MAMDDVPWFSSTFIDFPIKMSFHIHQIFTGCYRRIFTTVIYCGHLWVVMELVESPWCPQNPSEDQRFTHWVSPRYIDGFCLQPSPAQLLQAGRQREGNVNATWRQREGNVNQMETSYRVQPTRPYSIKINSRTFKFFQQCWCLVFVLFLSTAATSVLQKQPWRSGMGQNGFANSLDKFVYVQHQKAFNHPFVGMFTEIRSIIFMSEVKIHKVHTHVLIHIFPGFSWIILNPQALLLSFQDSQVLKRSISIWIPKKISGKSQWHLWASPRVPHPRPPLRWAQWWRAKRTLDKDWVNTWPWIINLKKNYTGIFFLIGNCDVDWFMLTCIRIFRLGNKGTVYCIYNTL